MSGQIETCLLPNPGYCYSFREAYEQEEGIKCITEMKEVVVGASKYFQRVMPQSKEQT